MVRFITVKDPKGRFYDINVAMVRRFVEGSAPGTTVIHWAPEGFMTAAATPQEIRNKIEDAWGPK